MFPIILLIGSFRSLSLPIDPNYVFTLGTLVPAAWSSAVATRGMHCRETAAAPRTGTAVDQVGGFPLLLRLLRVVEEALLLALVFRVGLIGHPDHVATGVLPFQIHRVLGRIGARDRVRRGIQREPL